MKTCIRQEGNKGGSMNKDNTLVRKVSMKPTQIYLAEACRKDWNIGYQGKVI